MVGFGILKVDWQSELGDDPLKRNHTGFDMWKGHDDVNWCVLV